MSRVAEFIIDQRDEPWPGGAESDRLHYWRDKAIKAANDLRASMGRGMTVTAAQEPAKGEQS